MSTQTSSTSQADVAVALAALRAAATAPTSDESTDAPDAVVVAETTIRAALDDVIEAVHVLDRTMRYVESLDVDTSAALLKDLRDEVIKQLRLMDDYYFVRHLAKLLRGHRDPVVVDGVGALEITRPRSRRAWQHDAAINAWFDALMTSTEGEVPDPISLIARLRESASISGWKVKGFRDLGLEVDDFCDSEPGSPSVRFL